MWYLTGLLSNGVCDLLFHCSMSEDLVSSKSVISGMSIGELKSTTKQSRLGINYLHTHKEEAKYFITSKKVILFMVINTKMY